MLQEAVNYSELHRWLGQGHGYHSCRLLRCCYMYALPDGIVFPSETHRSRQSSPTGPRHPPGRHGWEGYQRVACCRDSRGDDTLPTGVLGTQGQIDSRGHPPRNYRRHWLPTPQLKGEVRTDAHQRNQVSCLGAPESRPIPPELPPRTGGGV